MSSGFKSFGDPPRFQIALRWVEDDAPAQRRPARHGWSMGQLTIMVAGVSLTASTLGDDRQEHVGWYLSPALAWLADNWVSLLHEERFGWPTKDASPAAIACRRALDLWGGSEDETERSNYRAAQVWYMRHGLRSASAGGLFPDLFIRRFGDDIELSWSGDSPPHAPGGLAFESGAGYARLAVSDVAEPLWKLLLWVSANPPRIDETHRADWEALCARIDAISHLSPTVFDAAAVANELLVRIRESFSEVGRQDLVADEMPANLPFVTAFSPAVAMFGGVTPNLSGNDISALRDLLVAHAGGADSKLLTELLEDRQDQPVGRVPHEDGYRFASQFLDDLADYFGDYAPEGHVEVRDICRILGVTLRYSTLDTNAIRGVAIAGDGFGPLILINIASPFNISEDGRRFTLAHELCHILFDRTRARRIVHSSGPWAAPGIEKRANAFAAYLLMPPHLVRRHLPTANNIRSDDVRNIAAVLHVGETALVEHLYNLDYIDELQREILRQEFRPSLQSFPAN
jgi:Zn-dependent peptidase ImmA (M78 family)